jgi:hypothetical protein
MRTQFVYAALAASPALHLCPTNQKQRRIAPGTPEKALKQGFFHFRKVSQKS